MKIQASIVVVATLLCLVPPAYTYADEHARMEDVKQYTLLKLIIRSVLTRTQRQDASDQPRRSSGFHPTVHC